MCFRRYTFFSKSNYLLCTTIFNNAELLSSSAISPVTRMLKHPVRVSCQCCRSKKTVPNSTKKDERVNENWTNRPIDDNVNNYVFDFIGFYWYFISTIKYNFCYTWESVEILSIRCASLRQPVYQILYLVLRFNSPIHRCRLIHLLTVINYKNVTLN